MTRKKRFLTIPVEFDPSKLNLKEAATQFERRIIQKAIKQHDSMVKVAKVLGISQPTVVRKVQSMRIKQQKTIHNRIV